MIDWKVGIYIQTGLHVTRYLSGSFGLNEKRMKKRGDGCDEKKGNMNVGLERVINS